MLLIDFIKTVLIYYEIAINLEFNNTPVGAFFLKRYMHYIFLGL